MESKTDSQFPVLGDQSSGKRCEDIPNRVESQWSGDLPGHSNISEPNGLQHIHNICRMVFGNLDANGYLSDNLRVRIVEQKIQNSPSFIGNTMLIVLGWFGIVRIAWLSFHFNDFSNWFSKMLAFRRLLRKAQPVGKQGLPPS